MKSWDMYHVKKPPQLSKKNQCRYWGHSLVVLKIGKPWEKIWEAIDLGIRYSSLKGKTKFPRQ